MQAASEFDIIEQYFKRPVPDSMLGVGDDCALLHLSLGCRMAVSTDMLIEGRHFLPDTDPYNLGYKSLAVNLSDLAAMGAKPLACTLSLALPKINHDWLRGFAAGFHQLSQASNCPLVGGDTTRSLHDIVISVTVMGEVRRNHALRRDKAKAGDDIWVSGSLGAAYVALQLVLGQYQSNQLDMADLLPYMEHPEPRLQLGCSLSGVANAAIDISDGLLQDLGHILTASNCGAVINYDQLPLHPKLHGLPADLRQNALLAGGDAYELCFTVRPRRAEQIQAIAQRIGIPVSRIGTITADDTCVVLDGSGNSMETPVRGFDHFAV